MIGFFSPRVYIQVCRQIVRWVLPLLIGLFPMIGYWIFIQVPIDATQGAVFRMIYIHVPMAIASMMLLIVVGILSSVHWVWHIKVADWIASLAAKWGACCTAITLITGSLWGYYTWGTWWVWDARLTSVLMLFFIYLAYIIVDQASERYLISKQALVIISLLGIVDIPLVHYSVQWWQSLHQGSTLLNLSQQTMPWPMLWPLLVMIVALALTITVVIAHGVLKRSLNQQSYESASS
jgi:heme exporter protein C